MKKFFLGLGVLSISLAMARSSVDRQLENCSGDLTCVSKVLAELIESGQGGNNSVGGIVEFYHDDGRCEMGNLLKRVRFGITSDGCARAAESVRESVWGVKVDGVCSNISDTSFVDACNRYAAVEKNAAPRRTAQDASEE